MSYVIVHDDGRYAAAGGYTRALQDAKRFDTREAAVQDCAPRETVLNFAACAMASGATYMTEGNHAS